MGSTRPTIDREALRAHVRKLRRTDHLALLDGAIDLFSDGDVMKWVAGRIDLRSLQRTRGERQRRLLEMVRDFHAASLAGSHFDDFAVNSRNCTQTSDGTAGWITECERLFEQCAAGEAKADPAGRIEIRDSFRLLFDLLRRVDRGEEIVFFADEGGSYEVGVNWGRVLPCHFRCLAASVDPTEYADEVTSLIRDFVSHDQEKMLGRARSVATREQRRALDGAGSSATAGP